VLGPGKKIVCNGREREGQVCTVVPPRSLTRGENRPQLHRGNVEYVVQSENLARMHYTFATGWTSGGGGGHHSTVWLDGMGHDSLHGKCVRIETNQLSTSTLD
jgi:hypothetical protein